MADTSTTQDNRLTITVEQPTSFARRLSISVPGARVERVRRSVAQQITRSVRLPGFRKGHIPQNLLDKQFGQAIQQETVDRALREQKQREWNPVPKWPLAAVAGLALAGLGLAAAINRRRNV